MQAQIEKTINLNMSAQTILAKFPKKIPTGLTSLSESSNIDYETYFRPLIDYVSVFFVDIYYFLGYSCAFYSNIICIVYFKPEYEFLTEVSVLIAEAINNTQENTPEI